MNASAASHEPALRVTGAPGPGQRRYVRKRTDAGRRRGYCSRWPQSSGSSAAAAHCTEADCSTAKANRVSPRSHSSNNNIQPKDNMNRIIRQLASLAGLLLIVTAVGCASTAKQEGTGEYVDDTVITTKVKAAILNEPTLKSAEINVETFKGIVQLSGFVSSAAAEKTAVAVTSKVGGVKSVKDDMRVK
jgi:hypothetical protein